MVQALMPVDPVAAATYFVEKLGCTAFPVWGSADGRCFCGDPHDGLERHQSPENVGKHPGTPHGFQDATSDLDRIATFLSNPGTPNYGLNAPPGVLAIDVDGEGLTRWEELQAVYGPLPITLTTLTAHGRHFFFRWPESAGPMPKGKLFGFVVRRHDDGYVIGPGSVHPSGFIYDTLRRGNGHPYDIAELPKAWAEAALKPPVTVGPRPLPQRGGRHDWLRDRARYFRGFMDNRDALRAALLVENDRLPEPKTAGEVDRAIGEVFERFPLDPPDETEEKVAARLHDDDLDLLGAPASGAFPAPPDRAAFGGLLGECVADLTGGTDASEIGLLGSLLAFCGALIPGSAYFARNQTSSPFIALVGESSIGRKGTAMTRVQDAMNEALEITVVNRVVLDGINSGEGLVTTLHYKREHYPHEPTVGLVYEEEYATLLASRGREGSTLDPKMRQAFDGGPVSNRRSGETKTVTPPYWLPALIGITPVELRHRLEPGALQSGSANRWLYLPVVRRDFVPLDTPPVFTHEHRQALIDAHRATMKRQPVLDVEAEVRLTLAEYADFLPRAAFGLAKDLTRRLQVIAFRVALVHALAERSRAVTSEHLRRALALTEYARRGIAWVFGDTIGNPDADLLFRHLLAAGRLTRRAITQQIVRDPIRRQGAIDELLRLGRAQVLTVHSGGRPRSELVPVPGGGTFVHFVQGSASPPTENTENLHVMHESPDSLTNGLHESRTEAAQKVHVMHESPPLKCHFYLDHQSQHTQDAEGWYCSICSPRAT